MMKKMKNNLDECQELKLLQIEHRGCWLAFWGLLISIIVQIFLGLDQPKEIVGEWIVFMVLAIYITGACIKNGIWDRTIKPTPKNNLIASLLAGIIVGALHFSLSYHRFHKIYGSVATGVFMFFMTFIVCFAALSLSVIAYKKRVQKLEDSVEEISK